MRNLPDHVRKVVDDESRLQVLSQFVLRSQRPDPDFDTITRIVADEFDVPIAFICMVDRERPWLQSAIGIDLAEGPIGMALSAYTIELDAGGTFIVTDATRDPRFAAHPHVSDGPRIRFFAGAPITIEKRNVGVIGLIDNVARTMPEADQLQNLTRFASLAGSLFTLKEAARGRKSSDRALSRARTRHSLAFRAANIASWSWDIRTDVVDCDVAMRQMFKLPREEVVTGAKLLERIDQNCQRAIRRNLKRAIRENVDWSSEFHVASTDRWLLGLGRIYERAENGDPLSALGVVVDITKTKQSEQKTRLLLRELNHRVKNTLAILQSLASQTLRRSDSAADFTMSFSGRLQAIAAAHTLLSDQEWGDVGVFALLRGQMAPYAVSLDEDVVIHGDDVALGPDEALGLGLVIHELATNAAKYGALSVDGGTVDIAVSAEAKKAGTDVVIDWTEKGGPTVSPPTRQGFGTTLITRSLDKIVGSDVALDFAPGGLRVRMRFPVSRKDLGA
ncbi:sensor histidine kinase [Rhodobium gokarnense]|uniref:Blue-light-activated histidine kinase n=1 Tax=Rhodobium gokarnense TaxID=364296 RepID=A0ABT3H8A5_9HYPH|nr:HWE histidine kinase domain-containing protein [Rhodobium gokarnense]MCW2306620.1 two-component sensor histidine kinase [Rhodobium gokarnense]